MSAPIALVSQRAGPVRSDETNHRVANQLALIVSAIGVRASSIAKGPSEIPREDVLLMLQVIIGRIVSLGELNRSFAQTGEERTDVQKCLVETSAALVAALSLEDRMSVAHRLTANCTIDAQQAQALALLINEVMVNALKHAHPTGLPVVLTLACDRLPDGRIALEIADDGVGLPEDFDTECDGGVGFKVIRSLCECLGAKLEIHSDSLGLTFRFLLAQACAGVSEAPPVRAAMC